MVNVDEMDPVILSDELVPEDKKYSLKFLIVTDLFCFFVGFGFHYLVDITDIH